MSCFLKFKRTLKESNGQRLHWGRAGADGAPFRGEVPLLREEEHENNVEPVNDFHYGMFDLSRKAQKIDGRTYYDVMDAVLVGLYKLCTEKQFIKSIDAKTRKPKMYVYIEWAETFMEYNK